MRKVFITLTALLLTGCAAISSTPKPERSEYFTTLGGGFITTLGPSITHQYGVNLVINKQLPKEAYAVLEFQNPADALRPQVYEGPIVGFQKRYASKYANVLILKSANVQGIAQHTNYAVFLTVYSDSSKQQLIAQHKQLVNSEYIEN